MNVPTLLITFNRPDYTRQMLDALRNARVDKLYVFKDGPRPNNQEDRIASREIERLIKAIDWECEVKTMFLNNNLGCGFGPYTAISWAFENEKELIILEDDCVPTKAFFDFCENMLGKYADNPKVSLISGRNQFYDPQAFKDKDYIFTQYAPTWGWATWKRVWTDFDIQMRNLDAFFEKGGFTSEFSTLEEATFFNRRFNRDKSDLMLMTHAWDYQFGYYSRMNGALRIMPAKNLIKYIGMEGTHSGVQTKTLVDFKADENFIVKCHPVEISVDKAFDYAYFKKYVSIPLTIKDRVKAAVDRRFKLLVSK